MAADGVITLSIIQEYLKVKIEFIRKFISMVIIETRWMYIYIIIKVHAEFSVFSKEGKTWSDISTECVFWRLTNEVFKTFKVSMREKW